MAEMQRAGQVRSIGCQSNAMVRTAVLRILHRIGEWVGRVEPPTRLLCEHTAVLNTHCLRLGLDLLAEESEELDEEIAQVKLVGRRRRQARLLALDDECGKQNEGVGAHATPVGFVEAVLREEVLEHEHQLPQLGVFTQVALNNLGVLGTTVDVEADVHHAVGLTLYQLDDGHLSGQRGKTRRDTLKIHSKSRGDARGGMGSV